MLGKLEIKHHRARHGYVLLSGQNFLKRLHTKNKQVPQARPGIRLTALQYPNATGRVLILLPEIIDVKINNNNCTKPYA